MERKKVNIAQALMYWRMEYKGGRVVDLGYPKSNILHPEHGVHGMNAPTRGKTIGDLCQDAYMLMCDSGYRKPAIALEITVFKPEMIWEDKERALRQVGITCPTKLLLSQFAGVGALVMESVINTGKLPEFNPVKITCNSEKVSVNSV